MPCWKFLQSNGVYSNFSQDKEFNGKLLFLIKKNQHFDRKYIIIVATDMALNEPPNDVSIVYKGTLIYWTTQVFLQVTIKQICLKKTMFPWKHLNILYLTNCPFLTEIGLYKNCISQNTIKYKNCVDLFKYLMSLSRLTVKLLALFRLCGMYLNVSVGIKMIKLISVNNFLSKLRA